MWLAQHGQRPARHVQRHGPQFRVLRRFNRLGIEQYVTVGIHHIEQSAFSLLDPQPALAHFHRPGLAQPGGRRVAIEPDALGRQEAGGRAGLIGEQHEAVFIPGG
ncbi:hypothetical protein G6F23_015004 [Rhizopus arrhizus]|nr:hypothetical protein G6F23_015004 [Rhizopus arrhizus]